MALERNGKTVVDVDDSRLLKMSVAASIAGGMIPTMNKNVGVNPGPAVPVDEALLIFAQVYERMFGERWEPPTRRG